MNAPRVTILLCAAGSSSRMRGADKLLEEVDGRPLLRRQAEVALATGRAVIVTLPSKAADRQAALAGLAVSCVPVAQAHLGMAESLRRGIAAVPPDNAALVMLADMPEIETADLLALIDAHAESGGAALVQAAGADGTPGHPVLFPADCLADFAALAGDTGARAILRENRHRRRLVPLAGRRALVDLDTPEDWAAWRARR